MPENVRAELARRRVTQRALADELGLSQQAVSLKLAGARPFTDREITLIADLLGIDPGALFARSAS